MLTIWVDGEPRAKQSFKYAGSHSFTPARITAWQADVGWAAQQEIRRQKLWGRGPVFSKEVELAVKMEFHLKDRRRIDLDNLSKSVLDGLNRIVFADDRQIIDLHITKQVDLDKRGVLVMVGLPTELLAVEMPTGWACITTDKTEEGVGK